MKKLIILLIASLFFINIIPVSTNATTINKSDDYFYVDANLGSNENDGSEISPWQTIQYALDNVPEHSTIYVKTGTYYENVRIKKELTLKGMNKQTTIIDGQKQGNVVEVFANYVSINGFTIQNSAVSGHKSKGIMVDSSEYDHGQISNVDIYDNIIQDNTEGITIEFSYFNSHLNIYNNIIQNNGGGIRGFIVDGLNIHDNTISNNLGDAIWAYCSGYEYAEKPSIIKNNIIKNNGATGIQFRHPDGALIEGNEIINNGRCGIDIYVATELEIKDNTIAENKARGISLHNVNYSTISNNEVYENSQSGIYLTMTKYFEITNNDIRSNIGPGLQLESSNSNTIKNNKFENDGIMLDYSHFNDVKHNTVNGKALVYLEGVSGRTISQDAGQVILVESSHIKIKNKDISNTDIGIILWKSTNCEISENKIHNNEDSGIALFESNQNSFSNNEIYENGRYGIFLSVVRISDFVYAGSKANIIENNKIKRNSDIGIYNDLNSDSTLIKGNDVEDNLGGIYVYYSDKINIVNGNNIKNNDGYGIRLENSFSTLIENNNLIGNNKDTFFKFTLRLENGVSFTDEVLDSIVEYVTDAVTWNKNYWDNFDGADTNSDGFGDTSYIISGKLIVLSYQGFELAETDVDDEDSKPLMEPFEGKIKEKNKPFKNGLLYSLICKALNRMPHLQRLLKL